MLPYPGVKPGPLLNDRTEQAMPFQVIRTDFAGPIYYRTKTKKESKAYILIFSRSVSRNIHSELIPNTMTIEFVKCLKRLVAPRGNLGLFTQITLSLFNQQESG